MPKTITTSFNKVALGVAAAMAVSYAPASFANETEWAGFVENATYHRESYGIAKSRNTAQLEFSRNISPSDGSWDVGLYGTLRATYDAVYDLNDDEFGANAGGPIMLQNTGGAFAAGALPPGFPTDGYVAHGEGLSHDNAESLGYPGAAGNAFLNTDDLLENNPNEGMIVLGEHLHDQDGGVAFGVPVRPCDVDSRGCINDYMDADEDELKHPEFNDRWDFIRELYVDATRTLDNGDQLNIRLGKQQVVWGRTDLFRVLDVINPVDYSRHNIYDELEDIRIPMWILQAERRMGPTGAFDDLNVSMVWNFDKFRPHNLGSCSGAYNPLDAACFFRGMKNLWENGGTVANFAGLSGDTEQLIATNFGPNQIGIRDIHLPEWSLENTQLGFKLEGVYKDLTFSLNALTYRSQLPSLRGGSTVENSVNPFTGEVGPTDYLIAFDIHFPRINLVGGSLDYYSEALDSVFRLEAAYTQGEEYADSMSPELYTESDVFRYVIGIDKTIMIRSLNKSRGFLVSGQLFGEHLLDHRSERVEFGERGFAQWKSNNIATLLIKGWWMNDRLSPQIIMAHDFRASSSVAAPSVEYLVNDNWKIIAGANIKFGNGAQSADDCRACNPYGPFTGYGVDSHLEGSPVPGLPLVAASAGLSGLEPTGRFRSGIIGMANEEDEYQLTVQYRF